MIGELDLDRIDRALDLAVGAIGLSDPNPRVGCVIGRADGTLLGSGHTQAAGQAHAEAMALLDARRQHGDGALLGATAWVTLEPCAHHGRTPPCADALVEAGVARVVVAASDPHPAVAGRGLARLRAAGIEVELLDASQPAEAARVEKARDLNLGFFSRHERGRPWVRVKMAASIDGLTALPDGRSQWITGPEARVDGHRWRARAGVILTGIGTVLADDPRLDTREHPVPRPPFRLVLDSAARISPDARLFAVPGRVVVAVADDVALPPAWSGLASRIEVLRLGRSPAGRGLDLGQLMRWLTAEEVNEVHVEAGPTLAGRLLDDGWIDEWLLYLAPRLLGSGRPLVASATATGLSLHPEWRVHRHHVIGDDLALVLRRRDPGASCRES
jgi:diaminohydroxyphosphoribosylaminopyrimidine deaminase/5-amino-6-(5-phosphoribosylamino)uracil reductase